jgi:hypothetical protein
LLLDFSLSLDHEEITESHSDLNIVVKKDSSLQHEVTNVVVMWPTLLLRIWEIPVSNLGPDIGGNV